MKTINKILSLFAVLALAAVSLAQTSDTPPATPAGPGPDGGHPMIRRMMKHRMHMLSHKLNLTPEQVTKVKEIWKQTGAQAKALRQNDALTQGEARAQGQALRKSAHDQVRAVLTPEQQAIFDTLPADGPQRGGHKGAPGS